MPEEEFVVPETAVVEEIDVQPEPAYTTEEVDIDGDGEADGMVYSVDYDGDGVVDAVASEIDVDGDGDIDMLSYEEDTNGDGFMDAGELRFVSDDRTTDYVVRYADIDGDGAIDVYETSEEESFFHTPDDLNFAPEEEEPVVTPIDNETPSEDGIEYFDVDGDGNVDTIVYAEDLDGDGIADVQVAEMDIDNDGDVDAVAYGEDTDGDGVVDTVVTVIDENGDGEADVVVYSVDTDGDGVADVNEVEYLNGEEAVAPSEEQNAPTVEPVVETESEPEVEPAVVPSNEPSETVEYLDTDGDGVVDTIITASDTDCDGQVDTATTETDTDGDGVVDTLEIIYDRNGDGIIDAATYAEDTDGDGVIDTGVTEVDTDFDGNTDVTVYEQDTDNDGVIDVSEEVYADEDVPADEEIPADNEDAYTDDDEVYIPVLDASEYDTNDDNGIYLRDLDTFDPSEANPDAVIGNPEEAMELWEPQGATQRCAIYSMKFVIEEYTGEEVDIEELCDFAEAGGWFDESCGSNPDKMSLLLNEYGVPNETSRGNDIQDIADALAEGKKVIVGVDSGEYWDGENDYYTPGNEADHAIEVIGIDNTDPDNPMVIVNDSGNPYSGRGCAIPMDTFIDAWEDSGCFMIECM